MAIATNREQLDNGSPSGCRVDGIARQVINGATLRTLLVGESGALCLFNVAAGVVYTLPAISADDIGMYFDFSVSVTGTGSYSIDTDSATTFIGGGMIVGDTTPGGFDIFPANIASHVSIDLDSTETGEDAGGYFTLCATSTTTWICGGYVVGSGTTATPFA